MKKTIWKYGIKIQETFSLVMPEKAQILSINTQFGNPVLWALIDPNNKPEEVKFRVYGTGHLIDNSIDMQYIDTIQELGGGLVWHIFRVLDKSEASEN